MKKKVQLKPILWKIMRFTFNQIIIIALFSCMAYGHNAKGQDILLKKVSLKTEALEMKTVLRLIEKQANVKFVYSSNTVKTSQKVSVDIYSGKLETILDDMLTPLSISYEVFDNRILLKKKATKLTITPNLNTTLTQKSIKSIAAQTVKGIVTDAVTGEGLPNASVIVKGTTKGTITDLNGTYSLDVDNDKTVLVFSYVGFETKEVLVGSQTVINIALSVAEKSFETVVVTALGIKREEKALGYSVQRVTGESLQKVAGVDVATSLTGKIAGLLVKNSPDFAAVPDLTIRGEKPLLVIDGIAYQNKTLSDIAAGDIETMSVLKGATASALYGFRGANGAILITTKNGSTGKAGITVDATSNTMYTAGFLAIPEKQSVYGRGGSGIYDINSDESWGQKIDGSQQNQWDPIAKAFSVRPYLPIGQDNFANFLEQGYVTNNNFNIGYKKDNVSLRNSFNWTENKGQYPNSKLDKYTFTSGADFTFDKLKMSTNLSYAKKKSPNIGSNGYTSYDPMYSILIWSPSDWNLADYKDNYWIKRGEIQNNHFGLAPNGTIDSYKGKSENNPYFDRWEKTNEISRDIFNADLTTSYQLASWMKATVRAGIDFYKETGQLRSAWGSYLSSGNTGVPGADYSGWNGGRKGQYNIGVSSGFSTNSDLLLTGDKQFGKLNVEYLGGGTIFYKKDDNVNASTQGGISVPGFYSIKASINSAQVSQSTRAQQVNSLFGRVGVSWNRMLYVEATGRNDWSSTLPAATRSYFYPSVASSFVISELLPGTQNWLDLLKLRGSWTVSKRPADIYEINSSYSISAATWGALNGAGVPGNLYSPTIAPTSSETYETGLQGMIFKNRLMVDVSYYTKRVFDRITTVGLTGASGYGGLVTNFGEEITRRGWEVIVNGSPIKNKDWQLDLGFNWSTYASYYSKLDPTYSKKLPWVQVGERSDHFISRNFLYDPNGNLIHNSSGRPIVSSYDSKFGYYDPNFVWGTNSTLRYKNISLFISFDGVVGGLANTRTESYMWQAGVHPESLTPERALDVATPGSKNYLGQGVKIVSGTATYDAVGNITKDTREYAKNDIYTTYKQYTIDLHNSSAWGGNGSLPDTYSKTFFKLREISLTYTLPTKMLNSWAKAASISFVGQNVLLKAKQFKYSDPDGGNEDFADPSVRYLGGNIKITF